MRNSSKEHLQLVLKLRQIRIRHAVWNRDDSYSYSTNYRFLASTSCKADQHQVHAVIFLQPFCRSKSSKWRHNSVVLLFSAENENQLWIFMNTSSFCVYYIKLIFACISIFWNRRHFLFRLFQFPLLSYWRCIFLLEFLLLFLFVSFWTRAHPHL